MQNDTHSLKALNQLISTIRYEKHFHVYSIHLLTLTGLCRVRVKWTVKAESTPETAANENQRALVVLWGLPYKQIKKLSMLMLELKTSRKSRSSSD
jgi:hypothetical protein